MLQRRKRQPLDKAALCTAGDALICGQQAGTIVALKDPGMSCGKKRVLKTNCCCQHLNQLLTSPRWHWQKGAKRLAEGTSTNFLEQQGKSLTEAGAYTQGSNLDGSLSPHFEHEKKMMRCRLGTTRLTARQAALQQKRGKAPRCLNHGGQWLTSGLQPAGHHACELSSSRQIK